MDSASLLRLRAGALGEERDHVDLGIFGFEGHVFLGEREAARCSSRELVVLDCCDKAPMHAKV